MKDDMISLPQLSELFDIPIKRIVSIFIKNVIPSEKIKNRRYYNKLDAINTIKYSIVATTRPDKTWFTLIELESKIGIDKARLFKLRVYKQKINLNIHGTNIKYYQIDDVEIIAECNENELVPITIISRLCNITFTECSDRIKNLDIAINNNAILQKYFFGVFINKKIVNKTIRKPTSVKTEIKQVLIDIQTVDGKVINVLKNDEFLFVSDKKKNFDCRLLLNNKININDIISITGGYTTNNKKRGSLRAFYVTDCKTRTLK